MNKIFGFYVKNKTDRQTDTRLDALFFAPFNSYFSILFGGVQHGVQIVFHTIIVSLSVDSSSASLTSFRP